MQMSMINTMRCAALMILMMTAALLYGQAGTVRGNVYDKENGEPISFGTVRVEGTDRGVNTDLDGFFNISNLEKGTYKLIASYIGYDSVVVEVVVKPGAIVYQRILMGQNAVSLGVVDVSASREQARSDVQISKLSVTPKQIRSLPSTGGESDIAQYLPVLPGVIVSGDQGGQLYIRGGSPVQNKILLDGMTIYNPFHSIGFFSVFETETIRSVDVLTGGFNAEHGGRVSAVVDIKTRDGNKKRLSGLVSASPFQAKALIEGPIIKLNESSGGSTSFLFTAKHSYLDQTSKLLYAYAVDTTFFSFAAGDTSLTPEQIGLPYRYTDVYGKVSFVSGEGSKLNLFGFNFTDRFDFAGLASVGWDALGAGANFTLVMPTSDVVIDGTVAISDYDIALVEVDGGPRTSSISNFMANLNFTYFGEESQLNYGIEFNGFNTNFTFRNLVGLNFSQRDFTTELAGYAKYKRKIGNLIMEPGLRVQFYASQPALAIEPRLGLKYNITKGFRLKAAGGFYSQNLISTVNELDVVNFFVGFLAGPSETFFKPGSTEPVDHRLQKSIHAIFGTEIDLTKRIEFNAEAYLKRFTQLISINRNKLSGTDPNYETETGDAYGIDFTLKYEGPNTYIWTTYSLAYVNRNDGQQIYPTIFDRRHNVNVLATYAFGAKKGWEASIRWNFGSGFPFTRTQGFYEGIDFNQLLFINILTGNGGLSTILSGDRNDGRLSAYHRMDASLKRTFNFGKYSKLEAILSITNIYNRENIFYIDRITNNRVNQLPFLPSVGVTYTF